jgi:tetratricopeptide (TPR) repeat protein
MTLIKSGQFVKARPVAEEALARSEDTGARAHAIWARLALGAIQTHQGRYQEARIQWQACLDLARELGLRVAAGRFLELLGAVALRMEAYPEAQRLMEEGASLVQAFGSPPTQNSLFIHLAYLSRRLGEPSRSRRYLHLALQWVVEARDADLLMFALPAVALLWADAGDVERAVELYALASRHPFVANSCWFQDVAEKPIVARAATLPPQVVAAAQERGRARDLWDTAAELVEELKHATTAPGIVGLRVQTDHAGGLRHGVGMPASEDGGRSPVGE